MMRARLGKSLDHVVITLAARLAMRRQGQIGQRYPGFRLDWGEEHQRYGAAFGRLDGRLMRMWWQDVFGEPMPHTGSRQWRVRLMSLNVPPPGPARLLLATDDMLSLEGGGALRLAG